MYGVAVGRFSPIHLGHERVIETMREQCNKCLLVMGSSNAPTSKRDFFSYTQRRLFIKNVYASAPALRLVGMPDYHSDEQWLLALDDILCATFDLMNWQVKHEVTFFGGSPEDVRFFIKDGRKVHIVNRFDGISSPKISASEIRDDLLYGRSVGGKLNSSIIDVVTTTFKSNWEIFDKS